MTWLFVAIAGILLGLTVRVAAVIFCVVIVAAMAAFAFLLDAIDLSTVFDILVALVVLQLFYLAGLLIVIMRRSARGRSQ